MFSETKSKAMEDKRMLSIPVCDASHILLLSRWQFEEEKTMTRDGQPMDEPVFLFPDKSDTKSRATENWLT